MKHKLIHSMLFLLLFVAVYVPVSYSDNSGPQTFNIVLTNDVWDGNMTYTVDIYVKSTDSAPIELAAFSLGLTVNLTDVNGGTITASFVPASSQLTVTAQIPTSFNAATTSGSVKVIKIAAKTRSEERRVGKEGRSRWWPYY